MNAVQTEVDAAKAQTPSKRVLEEKWGKSVIAAGYTVMPTIVLRYQQRLKLTPLQINILLQVLSYWWGKKDNLPRPGKKALAAAVGVDVSTVRRCLKELEEVGYIKRISRRKSNKASQPNEYDPQGLIDVLQPIALEELEEIQKRKAKQLQRLAGKKPELQLVKK